MTKRMWLTLCLLLLVAAPASAVNLGMKVGTPDLKSAGPLAFGPDGVLFVGDALGAALFAIDTEDNKKSSTDAKYSLEGIDKKIAEVLGTTAEDILINDLAVNPVSETVYLSVSRGRATDAIPVILQITSDGKIKHLQLKDVAFAKAELANAPENKVTGEGRRRGNQRLESITDVMFHDGRVYVAGLSNEEFASKLRSIPFPFTTATDDTSIEIFHGSHGQLETRSPVRTFALYEIDGSPHVLAAYTCTPLVKIAVDKLVPGKKVTGDTVAELGNHNRPLDMVVYQKDGEGNVLMANNSRGLMKISLKDIAKTESINKRIPDKAGLDYKTIDDMTGVVQLDRLGKDSAVAIVQTAEGQNLTTMALP
jgi:hypothetical protein